MWGGFVFSIYLIIPENTSKEIRIVGHSVTHSHNVDMVVDDLT